MKSIRTAALAMSLMVAAESETASSAPVPAAAKPLELKNSHWCIHSAPDGRAGHGLGMIGEIGAQVRFHRFRPHSGDEAPSLDSEPVICELADLTLCTPDQLPAHLGYTPEQLKDLGYAR